MPSTLGAFVDLHAFSTVLTGDGPFVTVLVDSESDVEQAAEKYELEWRNVVRELERLGVDPRTRDAVAAARGDHAEGSARLVVASVPDATVRLAVSLATPPRRPVVDLAPLPHLRSLVHDVTSRVPYLVVRADRTGADVSAFYNSDDRAAEVTVKGSAPDIRKVPTGGWSHLRYQHRAENGWAANAKEIVAAVVDLAEQVEAELVVLVGDERELVLVREQLPQTLQARVIEVPGGRGADGSDELVRRRVANAVARHVAQGTLDLLAEFAQERGQAKRACDGLVDVVQALRKAQVETLLITTDTEEGPTLWFGPEPTQLATTARELADLGVREPREAPMVDVLIRAAIGTGAAVHLVPGETEQAPQMGIGAVLRYADTGTADSKAEAQA